MHVLWLQNTKKMFVFDHSLGTVTLISIPFTSYNALPSLEQYRLSLKIWGTVQNTSKSKKQTNIGFLMLNDHKSALHLEGVTFYKVIRNSNGTETILNLLLFSNCQLEKMRFIHSFDNMFLFSNHNVTHMNASKQYKENRGVRAF